MCDAFFTEPGIEAQIVRLEGSSQMEREMYVLVTGETLLSRATLFFWQIGYWFSLYKKPFTLQNSAY